MKKHFVLVAGLMVAGLIALPVSAHVVVKPAQVGVGQFQTFTIGVPVEKEVATTGLRLVIPAGLKHVSPNVKPGWKIEMKKSGTGEEATVTEISWTGGLIPTGQRDDFLFSAQVPAQESTVQWKAYQTYQDGSVVAWDQPRSENQDDFSTSGPYSETKVINDLKVATTPGIHAGAETTAAPASQSAKDKKILLMSTVALALSVVSLVMQRRKK